MNNQIKEYKKAREKFLEAVNRFPEGKRIVKLFGTWSIKDMLAHIVGWECLSVEKVRAIKNRQLPEWIEDVDKQNAKVVKEFENKDWSEVYAALIKSGNEMIQEYESLPAELCVKQAGPNLKYTPQRFLEQETKHYQENHLQKIEHYLKLFRS